MFSIKTKPPPGFDNPAVLPLLRAMLYTRVASVAERMELRREIERQLPTRNGIVVRAKLLSLMNLVLERPWAFPACLSTAECRAWHARFKKIADASQNVEDALTNPFADAGAAGAADRYVKKPDLRQLVSSGAFAVALSSFFSGKSADWYNYYRERLAVELALRGIPSSALR